MLKMVLEKNKSTCTAIQTFIGEVQKILENKQLAFGIFLDLSTAFDVIRPCLQSWSCMD
jgi:hypothetical protein